MNETSDQINLKIQQKKARALIEQLKKNNNLINHLEKTQQNMMQSSERTEAMALASLQDDTMPYDSNRLEIEAQQLKEIADTLEQNEINPIIEYNQSLTKELCKTATIYELDLNPNNALEAFHIYGCIETGDMFSNKTIIPEVSKKISYAEWENICKKYKETKIVPDTVSRNKPMIYGIKKPTLK